MSESSKECVCRHDVVPAEPSEPINALSVGSPAHDGHRRILDEYF